MNAHFRHAFTHGFAIAKMTILQTVNAGMNPTHSLFVPQAGKPVVKQLGRMDDLHMLSDCIKQDTR